MKFLKLEFLQFYRSKFLFIVPAFFFAVFGLFFLLNTKENSAEIWEVENELNTARARPTMGGASNLDEEMKEKLETEEAEKEKVYTDVLWAGFERDKEAYAKGFLKTIDFHLKSGGHWDADMLLFFEKEKLFYSAIIQNKNTLIFDSANPLHNENHKPTLNLFKQNFYSLLPTHYIFLFLSLSVDFFFYQSEKKKSVAFLNLLPVTKRKKQFARLFFMYAYLAVPFLLFLSSFFLINTLFYGAGEWHYPVVVFKSQSEPALMTQGDFFVQFMVLFLLFLLFIVLFNLLIVKYFKHSIAIFMGNIFLFLFESLPFFQSEKMLKYREWFIGSFSNIAKVILRPEERGNMVVSMNGFYPTFQHSLLVLGIWITVFWLLLHIQKGGKQHV